VILALACLGHVGLILLLANGIERVRQRTPAREAEPLLLMLLDSLVRPEPEPPQPAQVPAPVLTPPSDIVIGPLPQIDSTGPAYAPPVSDSVPRVDWIDERRRTVANMVAREASEAARPKIGQPARGMDLPHEAFEHKAGVIEHREGGETIEWINDRCYYTTAQAAIPNPLGLMLPTCKPRANAPRKELRLDKRPDDAE
jgi:hypothetical protein